MSSNLLTPDEKVPVTIEDEMRRSYLDYAMSVIIGRALPDVRDGLKPVHRRCPVRHVRAGQHCQQAVHASPRASSVTCIGKYHPHGDTAIYDSVVRMAQDFSLRYPLVDGQGNFGSIDGDNAGRDALHRGPPDAAHGTSCSTRHRQGDRRLAPNYDDSLSSRWFCRRSSRTCSSTGRRHRGRHGDQHPAAQPDRSPRRDDRADQESRGHARGRS